MKGSSTIRSRIKYHSLFLLACCTLLFPFAGCGNDPGDAPPDPEKKGNGGAVDTTPKLSGSHYQFNIIGHPKNVDAISGDDSNGRSIKIPLRNTNGPGQPVLECGPDTFVVTNDTEPTFTDIEPADAKIHFLAGDDFQIIDRDATDRNGATVMVPTVVAPDPLGSTDGERVLAVDIYVRILGKPNQCMRIDGYAYDDSQALWFWSGRVDLTRTRGKTPYVNVNDLFDVNYCTVDFDDADGDGITSECIEGTSLELSVFNNVFSDYFWNIQNNGTRLVQVRLYPKTN